VWFVGFNFFFENFLALGWISGKFLAKVMENTNFEPELNSLRSKLVVEIENDTKQIDILKKRITKNEALLHAVRGSLGALHPTNKPTGYGSKSETIRDAINSITAPQFTQDDVESAIKKLNPDMVLNRTRIRSALWTLQDRNELIKIFSKGNNKQPAVYEKLSSRANGELNPPRAIPSRMPPPRRPVPAPKTLTLT
jgi:hypothetical protein